MKCSNLFLPNLASDLRRAIQDYKRLNPDEDTWINIDPETCSWRDVTGKVDEERLKYRSANIIRRAFRHGDDISRIVLPMLESIPNDTTLPLGILKGGLWVLVNASHGGRLPSQPTLERCCRCHNKC